MTSVGNMWVLHACVGKLYGLYGYGFMVWLTCIVAFRSVSLSTSSAGVLFRSLCVGGSARQTVFAEALIWFIQYSFFYI